MNYNEPKFKDGVLIDKKQPIFDGCFLTWNEALLLQSWGIYHIPSQKETENIVEFARQINETRKETGESWNVLCWIRPIKVNNPSFPEFHGRDYNKFIKGSSLSRHITGQALDFTNNKLEDTDLWDKVRKSWKGRMEAKEATIKRDKMPYNDWIHIDNKDYGKPYTFKP